MRYLVYALVGLGVMDSAIYYDHFGFWEALLSGAAWPVIVGVEIARYADQVIK
jgi:hypothetical protein